MSSRHHHRVTRTEVWPHINARVVIRDGAHRGETGTVVGRRGRHDWRYKVQVDGYEVPRLFAGRELRRPEGEAT